MRKSLITIILLILAVTTSSGQNKLAEDFKEACDSLSTLLHERTSVEGKLVLKSVMKRGNALDFYFTESLGDFPWYAGDEKWFKKHLKSLFPKEYASYKPGEIYSRLVSIKHLITPRLTFDSHPSDVSLRTENKSRSEVLVCKKDGMLFSKGMSGRHIALWQSHGRYYEQETGRWEWQRPCLFQTCEDMFTQGFVLPYLVPMLENAGAYVMLPRERDIQKHEIIADNDPTDGGRGSAQYSESGEWLSQEGGFADTKPTYTGVENPFTLGTYKFTETSSKPDATIRWTPDIPERGEYAVYISYKSLPNCTSAAHYTVVHNGGTTEFYVNQKMGGGTWIYLGTFEFEKGCDGYIMLDNTRKKGESSKSIVTADAVKIGGGMGNIAREKTSGMPRYAEAARYWLQWAGADSTIYHQNEGKNDYRDDFMCRGDWVEWISRGSHVNPKNTGGLNIPIDLSFGFHSDAGVTPNDSTIGTLAIYTYKSEWKTKLPAGESRMTSRAYADMVQSQIIHDIRTQYDSSWARRSIWDRAYRESRTPPCPAMLLELLSHQNFADMKYGHDPEFKFTVSRAVYKGMLKYLSNRYGTEYAVQPLPVCNIGIRFKDNNKATISWMERIDKIEDTSKATGFILYSKCDNGSWDQGTIIENIQNKKGLYQTEVDITPGKVMSYKIAAYNDGGLSFPSEIVCIGIPAIGNKHKNVLIVNNFDRVSGPANFDTPSYAGFDNRIDSGVADQRDITFVGNMYNFRREEEWITNYRPGFGASYTDKATEIVAGNTFDYCEHHGAAILDAGYPFYSCSNERFESDTSFFSDAWALDFICGKQISTPIGKKNRYTVFTNQIQHNLEAFAAHGGNIFISGAYIGTDAWKDASTQTFVKKTLGYDFITDQASHKGAVTDESEGNNILEYWDTPNSVSYSVESPDGIKPADGNGETLYRYYENGISAGVGYKGNGYKCISLGFPIETLKNKEDIYTIISESLEYFEND